MYLKRTPVNAGRVYLSIVDGYYDREKKYSKQITVEKLGYLDELENEYDDPISYFSRRVEELKNQKALRSAPLSFIFSHNEKIPSGSNRKNFGYAVLSKLYHRLGIHTFLVHRQRHSKEEYDANAILKMLVFQRLLVPASKKKTFENREYLFESSNFTIDDVYRCLSFLASRKDEMLFWLHENIRKQYGRDISLVYYDVTNFYFEVDGPEGYVGRKNGSDQHVPDGFRKKGVSKEHRPDPIVQMGLFWQSAFSSNHHRH